MIGILTYERPHRRSQDLIINMAKKYGIAKLCVITLPWKEIKKTESIFPVEFQKPLNMTQRELANFLYIPSFKAENPAFNHDVIDWFIIGGAQLLGEPFSTNGKTLNVHPGVIDAIRGLDSFKRSLLYGYPIGATLHIINKETDSGVILKENSVWPEYYDTIHSLRMKLYNCEQELLLEAADWAEKLKDNTRPYHTHNKSVFTNRMTHAEECELINKRGGFR